VFKDGKLIRVEVVEKPRPIPSPEEAVRRGIQNAPRTILGLLGGGIVEGLIAGPPGALILEIIRCVENFFINLFVPCMDLPSPLTITCTLFSFLLKKYSYSAREGILLL